MTEKEIWGLFDMTWLKSLLDAEDEKKVIEEFIAYVEKIRTKKYIDHPCKLGHKALNPFYIKIKEK